MDEQEQHRFAEYLNDWLGSTQDRPATCPICQGPVVHGPGPRGSVGKTVYQCARRCIAVCVEDNGLGLALFDVLQRVVTALRQEAVEQAATVRPPSMGAYSHTYREESSMGPMPKPPPLPKPEDHR